VLVEEPSMAPAAAPGDWLIVNPLVRRWPRPGAIVVFRDPDDDGLSMKRVAAGPGSTVPFAAGFLRLAEDEAWLLADADEASAAAAGFGPPRDSRQFGPVTVDRLVGQVVGRYGPRGRIGRVR
jgi:signal peptidase I